eukprot:COSAG03_NODE_7094_length_963_cov_2.451389_1_plen_64_part_10
MRGQEHAARRRRDRPEGGIQRSRGTDIRRGREREREGGVFLVLPWRGLGFGRRAGWSTGWGVSR